MRWLALVAASFVLSFAGAANAVPQPDAEAAYQRGDYATAYRLWLPLAEQGSPLAAQNIGRMYERGEGVPKDPQAAAAWYRKAAEQDKDLNNALDRVPMPDAPVTATQAQAQTAPVVSVPPQTASVPTAPVQRPVTYPPPVYYVPVYRVAPYRPAPMYRHFRH
jgi:hypothetical protein